MVLHPVPSVSRSPVGDEFVVMVWVVSIVVVLSVTVEDQLTLVSVAVVAVAATDKDTASTFTVDFCTVQKNNN